jgi:hypothetical protein
MLRRGDKSVVLGDEWDESLRREVIGVLRELGATFSPHECGHAGSQELEVLEAIVGDQCVRVEAETYIGLTVSGPAELIDRLQHMLSERIEGRGK